MSRTPAPTTQPSRPPAPTQARVDLYALLLLLCMAGYVALFAWLAFAQHAGMRTHKADLGQIAQAVWNSSRGRFVEMTDNGFIATRMTDHVEPILALISPVLWLWDDVRALLLLQAVFAAAGAWPLYKLARLKLESGLGERERDQVWVTEPLYQLTRPLAFVVCLAYLLAPQLQSSLLTEFHAVPLAVPLIVWAFWAVEARRWWQFGTAALLVASVKEETALLAAGLGVWALWRIAWDRWQTRRGRMGNGTGSRMGRGGIAIAVSVTVLSLIWFYLATFVIVPAHAVEVYGHAESGYFQRYGALGDSPADILRSVLTRPDLVWQILSEPARAAYLAGLIAPFGFLSLLAPEVLLLSLPVLLANALSAYPAQYYGEFHYSAPLVPYMAVSAAYGLARLWRAALLRLASTSGSFQHLPAARTGTLILVSALRNSQASLRPLAALALIVWVAGWAAWSYAEVGRGPLGGRYDPTPITAHHRLLERFTAQIPADAPLTATAAVHPHVSHRRYVYQFPIGLDDAPVPAEWALLDVTTATDMAPGDVKARVDAMLAAEWGVVGAADGFLLLRRGATEKEEKEIPDAFYDFARGSVDDAVRLRRPLTFASASIQDWPRWRQSQVVTQWWVGEGFDPETMQPQIEIRTVPPRETVYRFADAMPPALVWYPPSRWQAGEEVRITTLPIYLPPSGAIVVEQTPGLDRPHGGFAFEENTTFVEWFFRLDDGVLYSMSSLQGIEGDVALIRGQQPPLLREGAFRLPSGETFPVAARLSQQHIPAGRLVDVWIEWGPIRKWPDDLTVFVHLRRDGATLDQQDGLPRYFVNPPAEMPQLEKDLPIWDWRQLLVPPDAEPNGDWRVVVGLYRPADGERMPLVESGDELDLGPVRVGPPLVPDQACALIPATCASQPVQ